MKASETDETVKARKIKTREQKREKQNVQKQIEEFWHDSCWTEPPGKFG